MTRVSRLDSESRAQAARDRAWASYLRGDIDEHQVTRLLLQADLSAGRPSSATALAAHDALTRLGETSDASIRTLRQASTTVARAYTLLAATRQRFASG